MATVNVLLLAAGVACMPACFRKSSPRPASTEDNGVVVGPSKDRPVDSRVAELVKLAELPAPEQSESEKMQMLAREIARSSAENPTGLNQLLTRLLPTLNVPHPQSAGMMANLCARVAGAGADATLLAPALLARTVVAVQDAKRLVKASSSVTTTEEGHGFEIGGRWIPKTWVHEYVNVDALAVQSFLALDLFLPPLIGALSQRPLLLKSPDGDKLFDELEGLGNTSESALALDRLLRVPINETWLVLDLRSNVGIEMEVSGVSNAFQVYALMHQTLSAAGHLTSRLPKGVAEVADGRGPPSSEVTYSPPFAIFRWTVVNAARSIPDNNTQINEWHSNSAIPAEIARYKGQRVAVLGNSSIAMVFSAHRDFAGLSATMRLKRRLPEAELKELWGALASAPHPEPPIPLVGWR